MYRDNLELRLECVLLVSSLLKNILTSTLPYPTSDLAYATFRHASLSGGGGGAVGVASLFPGVELFSDTFRCSPLELLCTLRWSAEELVTRGHTVKVSVASPLTVILTNQNRHDIIRLTRI